MRGLNNENVPAFGSLEVGSKPWGQINPLGTRGPNTFPYDNGPDSVTTPNAGPIVGPLPDEEPQFYDSDDNKTMAILEAAERLSDYTDRAFKTILERLNNEA